MRRMNRWLAPAASLCLGAVLLAGCSALPAGQTTPAGNGQTAPAQPTVTADCSAVLQQLEALQDKYNQLNDDHTQLTSSYTQLDSDYKQLEAANQQLQSDNSKLKSDYNKLQDDYARVTSIDGDVLEGDLEQAIFRLINESRADAGVGQLQWADSLYFWAKEQSDAMAKSHKVYLSDYSYWQDVGRMAGQATAEQMATGMMALWEEDTNFPVDFLPADAKYAVVAVTRTGNVYYITYFAHIRP